MFKQFAIYTACAVLPSMAAADYYQCTTTNHGRGGWVSDRIDLEFDAEKGTARAIDAGIYTVHKKPIPVSFSRRSDTSYTFKWTLKGLKSKNAGSGTNSYRVTLFTSRNEFSLSGRRHGYDNVISGKGTCKRIN